MIRLIIFDMDGLMIDTERETMRAYLDMGREWGLPVTEEQFLRIIGKNSVDIKNQYRKDFGEDIDADRLYREIGQLREERFKTGGIPVKKGLVDLLHMLETKAVHIPLTVASGSDDETIRHHLEAVGLAHCFTHVLSSRDVARGKPAPDVFLALCDQFEVRPEETLVFEDSPNGVKAALAGHTKVIAVPDIIPLPQELSRDCYAVLPDLSQAIPLVEKLLEEDNY